MLIIRQMIQKVEGKSRVDIDQSLMMPCGQLAHPLGAKVASVLEIKPFDVVLHALNHARPVVVVG